MRRARDIKSELDNRWISYAVTLRASLVARRVEKQMLIDELKRHDPANAEQGVEQVGNQEYDLLEGAKLQPVIQMDGKTKKKPAGSGL